MGTYNVSKIEGWLEDFTSAKNKFNNTYYSDYKNSYIRSCSDSAVIRMRNKLNQHYDRIIRINNRIKNVWDDFLYDLKAVDNRLAGGKGSTNDSTVASKLSKLPSLKEYKADLKVRINSASAVVGTVDAIGWSEDKTLEENLQNSLEILGSTAAVTATSIVSGIFGLAEDLVDGVLLLGTQAVTGVATLFGEEEWAESAQNTMMDVISFDAVGEANKAFYENTSVGREINENSLIKYDSEIAQGIQDASTKLAEFAAATALTVATGGVAAPVAILIVGGTGYLIGSGDKAQESFSEEDRDFWEDSKETTIAGGIKAVEFYSEGKMGAGMVQAAGAIQSAGGVTNFLKNMRTALSNGKSSLFTRESLKNGFRATLKDADTYIDSIGAALNNITYDSENGLQVNWEGLVQETACNFALNSVFGFVGNSFETRMTNGMESLGLNAKSPDVNTSGMKNTIDDVNTNKAMFSSTSSKPKTDSNIASLRKEYDELLSKSKESWFVQAKEARDNGWAWNLNEINEVDNMVRRMEELEGSLGVKNTSIPESQIYDYSQAKKEADILAEEIREKPIPGFEKIDTNSQEYKSAIHAMYSNPSPSGKQVLSNSDNIVKQVDNIKVAYSAEYLGNQSYDLGRQGSDNYVKTIRNGNDFYINSKTFTIDDMKSINKNSRFKKTIVYITDDTDPNIIFQQAKKPKNVVVRVGDFEYLSDGNGIRLNQWRNTASVDPTKPPFAKIEKEKLDNVRKILNDWGRKKGVENYADVALSEYARTGSVIGTDGKPYITSMGGARDYIASLDKDIVSMYLQEVQGRTLTQGSIDTLYSFFKNSGSSYDSTYGVDQGGITSLCTYTLNGRQYSYRQARDMINNAKENGYILPRFKKQATKEYFDLKNKLISRGLTNNQASIILSSIDDVGACSYAAKANSIFYKFSNNPKLFEKTFGFPMYKTNANGETVLNSNELLLDMYLFANDTANGGRLFSKNYDGSYSFLTDNRIDVFGRPMLNTNNQVFMSTSNGSNNYVLSNYLASKGLNWSSYNLIGNPPNNVLPSAEFNGYIEAVKNSINDGKSVQLNIFSKGNEIRMINKNPAFSCTTRSWGEGGGHAIFITGMNNQGFIVSSWGREYLIPFSDLQNGGYFNIMIDDVY